ncbi:hypothetical protein ACS0TY_021623 [Phlomoides rotata]
MTMEEIRRDIENFPVGLRVLAVDDDQTCLKLLETLLRRCQYHVTTTSQARVALDMLRRDKDNYDLVISDVHMPDMDGFRLLELVGLEMDLPVIMLSGNSDPKLVMKGVTHGACDYLVKPIRIEELRNIWQHVFRRKKLDTKSQSKSTDQANAHQISGDDHGSPLTGNTDQSGKFTRKRKDEEDESEDMGNECDDPNAQKKARVVWSIDLHRKFVAAVNQLGIEKAVPKRILDLMNVDGLTRENVASHLQKYRLYLKRISTVASQQANMAAALGVKDSPFMHIGSFDGLGDFRTPRLANVVLSPYATGGMLGRLNSPSNVNLRNFTSSPLVQPSPAPNLTNSINSLGKMHLVLPPSTQNSSLLQGIPPSLELDQLQQNKGPTVSPNFNTIDNSRMFRPAIGSSNPLLNSIRNNPVILHGNAPQAVNGGGFGSHSTHNMASFSSGSFNAGLSGSSNLLDPGKCNENWQNTSSTEPFLASRDSNSANDPYIQNNPNSLSSSMTLPPFEDSREMPCQSWGEQTQTYAHISQSSANGVMANVCPSLDPNSGILNQKEMFVGGRSNGSASTLMQQNENGKMTTESIRRSNEDFLLEHSKLQGGFSAQGYDPLDELMNAMIKRV